MAITAGVLTIVEDSVAAGALNWDFEGALLTRKIVLKGMRSNANIHKATALWDAVRFMNLQPGNGHDTDTAWAVWSIQASPLPGNDKIEIIVRYRRTDLWVIRLDGNIISEQTSINNEGQLMTVSFTDKTPTGIEMPDDVAKVNYFRSGCVLEFEGFERGNQNYGLRRRVENSGIINSDNWQGCEPFTWMLMANRSNTTTLWGRPVGNAEFPDYYPVKYQFQYLCRRNSKGNVITDWRQVVMYVNWQLRQEPPGIDPVLPNATSGNGWYRGSLQSTAAFADLKLPQLLKW
jgi:hypothetical protein